MKKTLLSGEWKLYFFEQTTGKEASPEILGGKQAIPCTVPGNVELDMAKSNLIPEDLYMGMNILETEKYERYEWWYETKFVMPEIKGDAYLYFEGVDTLAQYWLDGELLGESDNMFLPVKLKIENPVKGKEYCLQVRLRSVILESDDIPFDLLTCVHSWHKSIDNATPIRKARHSYGWDIMPRALSAGLWKDVYLLEETVFDFNQLTYITDNLNKNDITIRFFYELNATPPLGTEIEFSGVCGNSEFYIKKPVKFKAKAEVLVIDNPKLWWPKGYGEANIYKTTVRLIYNGEVMSEKKINVGLRTVELKRTDRGDEENGYFGFIINNVPVMCYGTNWVPLDAFHSREKERYEMALSLLDDVGCNMVRWWGGNVYPEQLFYDFCDEHGIMVWQDFAMACATYPQDDVFVEKMKKEVEGIVRMYRHHPSLVLWAGDNECDEMTWQWTKDKENRLTREILPEVIYCNDENRPYSPSSPYIAKGLTKFQTAEQHLWGPRDFYKVDYYKNTPAHFASELGYHACPSPDSVRKFITPESVWNDRDNNPEWILHSTDQHGDNGRLKLLIEQIKQLFAFEPDNLDDFAFASQISQAEADKFYIERFRCKKPIKTGLIWWNLIDGWPQFSDAVVDYYGTKKLAYDYIKRVQEPVCVMIGEMTSWNNPVVIANDTLKERTVKYVITDIDTDEILSEKEVTIEANGIENVDRIHGYYSDHRMLKIVYEVEGKKYINHYLCGFPPFSFEQYKKWMEKLELEWRL